MDIAITAIGTANPIYRQCQKDTAEIVARALNLNSSKTRLLHSIYKATAIDFRHSVLSDYWKESGQFEFFPNDPEAPFPTTSARMKIYKDNALTLALAAIKDCFKTNENFNVKTITHLITVSCTGMYAPGLDIEIVQELKLNTTVKRTAINFMGCYGAFNAIKVAESIAKADPESKILIVCVELCTIHLQKNLDLDSFIANAIFADGASAALIEAKPSHKNYFSLLNFHCDLLPQSNQEMAWHIADHGFDMILSSYVPHLIKNGIHAFTETLLNQTQLNLQNIDFYAIHPGGLKILQACEEALNIDEEQIQYSYKIMRNYGNMSSATILFVLKELWNDVNSNDHNKSIFACAFGPGLTIESMLLKVHND